MTTRDLPLAGLTVLDFSQFLAGPTAASRLADLGADVVKVERFPLGDPSRSMVTAPTLLSGGDSLFFHAINRGKRSLLLDLKDEAQREQALTLVDTADVVIESYRPGVMERLGLGPDDVRSRNPRCVYGRVTGYGVEGPWRDRPGQDLLVQAASGLCWLQGRDGEPPSPIGFSIVDAAAGTALTQGILAALLRRERDGGAGGLVEVSLLEAALDLQFEVFTLHHNDSAAGAIPRSAVGAAHPWIPAPYGLYEAVGGWVAVAMGAVDQLGAVLGDDHLAALHDPEQWWDQRDDIKQRIGAALRTLPVATAVQRLLDGGLWASEVLGWDDLVGHPAAEAIDLFVDLERDDGSRITTTRCPFRLDGEVLLPPGPAPRLGDAQPVGAGVAS